MVGQAPLAVVTGATGFIGRCLCGRLRERGYRVRALLRRPPAAAECPPWDEWVCGRLGEGMLPAGMMEGADVVFHLAGIAHAFPRGSEFDDLYFSVNVEGSEAVATAAAAAGVRRLIYFSSIKAVAEPGARCVDEAWDAPPPESDLYGRSKREAERRLMVIAAETAMEVCALRPTLVYGPGAKGNLERMRREIRRGRFPPLPETGNRRSMVHLEDLVEAAMLAARHPAAAGRTYIVSDGHDYSTRQLYEAMCLALGRTPPRWALPAWLLRLAGGVGEGVGRLAGRRMPIDAAAVERLLGSACFRNERIVRELGFSPRFELISSLGGCRT
ncbi:SDR family oxidoreductase [Endothiovibrio diazotrophicus]